MRKLKLEVHDLEVISFDTHLPAGERGTVQGHKPPPPSYMGPTCNEYTCDPFAPTCDYATCGNGCYGTQAAGGVCVSWPYTGCEDCAYQSNLTCGC